MTKPAKIGYLVLAQLACCCASISHLLTPIWCPYECKIHLNGVCVNHYGVRKYLISVYEMESP